MSAAAVLLVAALAGGAGLLLATPLLGRAAARLRRRLQSRGAARRAAAATAAAPLALELAAAGLRAGLPLDRALAIAAGATDPALERLLRRALSDAAAGASTAGALARAAADGGVEVLAGAAALAVRRQRLGLPLAPQLLAIAAGARARHRAETLTRAARRGPLAGLVTATVVAPACALALLTLVLAGLWSGGQLLGPG